MKKFGLIIFILLMSCGKLIDKPKNLLEKEKVSELVAEFAINDQINNFVPGTNIENATRVVLKQKNIKPDDFIESYKYYTATGELEKILNNAQDIVINKDPQSKIFIEKKLEELEIEKKKQDSIEDQKNKDLQREKNTKKPVSGNK